MHLIYRYIIRHIIKECGGPWASQSVGCVGRGRRNYLVKTPETGAKGGTLGYDYSPIIIIKFVAAASGGPECARSHEHAELTLYAQPEIPKWSVKNPLKNPPPHSISASSDSERSIVALVLKHCEISLEWASYKLTTWKTREWTTAKWVWVGAAYFKIKACCKKTLTVKVWSFFWLNVVKNEDRKH